MLNLFDVSVAASKLLSELMARSQTVPWKPCIVLVSVPLLVSHNFMALSFPPLTKVCELLRNKIDLHFPSWALILCLIELGAIGSVEAATALLSLMGEVSALIFFLGGDGDLCSIRRFSTSSMLLSFMI